MTNIRGEGEYNSHDVDLPWVLSDTETASMGIWRDNVCKLYKQANGVSINVIDNNKYNLWNDNLYWSENGFDSNIYQQTKITNEPANPRSRIASQDLTLGIVLKNYDVALSGQTPTLDAFAFFGDRELQSV